ncbi:MAG TPA: winged helix DNA-binding domain-containing protein [Opitutaceae bacterium]|nr:winged helix DNA-binding domain-containing protein [Opitutaceae bacterium]
MRRPSSILPRRLHNQQIAYHAFDDPGSMVGWLGALQAQDYVAAKWSVGLRLPNTDDAGVERAIADKKIVRTWSLRATLHFMAADDVRWILALVAQRMIPGFAGRYRQLELDDKTITRSLSIFARALQGGAPLTRKELALVLERKGISPQGLRMSHLLLRAALDQLVCLGPRRDKEFTFVLLDEWLPATKPVKRDEALARIAERYFNSHGPATLRDFAGWVGLTLKEAKLGLELNKRELSDEVIDGETFWFSKNQTAAEKASSTVYLLPSFDEYLLGYKNRSDLIEPGHMKRVVSGENGLFNPTILIKGKVMGTWRRTFEKGRVVMEMSPFAPLSVGQNRAVATAAKRYGKFLGMPVELR